MTFNERSDGPFRQPADLEEKVRRVQHLEAFEYSCRDDGRFHLRLLRPPAELTAEDREAISHILRRLSEEL